MKPLKVLIIIFLVLTNSLSYAQRSSLEKANQLYKIKSYADAIPLFQKALSTKESLPAQTKLAYCYKMLNQMELAESIYAGIINEPRIRSKVYLSYGQVLMSLEKYEEAKKWFLKYHQLEPETGEGQRMALACDEVQFVEPYFSFVSFKPYAFNTDLDDTAPVAYKNGMVFSSDRNPGVKLLKQKSGTTGRDYVKLYYAKPDEEGNYKSPKSFSAKLNELNKNIATASFTSDGSAVYFTKNGSTANKKNAYTMQLYTATKAGGDRWKNVKRLSFCRPNYNYMHPCVSEDGQTLFFVSDKASGEGGTDIYYSVRRKDGSWSKPRNMGTNINTSFNEGFPFIAANDVFYFCSKGHVGYGGYDLFVSKKNANGEWEKAVNLGKPFNSSHDDVAFYLKDGDMNGFFTSSREGGDDDIYLFQIHNEPLPQEEPVENIESAVKGTPAKTTSPTWPLEGLIDIIMRAYSEVQNESDDIFAASDATEDNSEIQSSKMVSDDALIVKKEAHEQLLENEMIEQEMNVLESQKEDSAIVAAITTIDEGAGRVKLSYEDLKKKIKKSDQQIGMYCVVEGLNFFPGEYLLDPSKTKLLEPLANLLKGRPNLKIEISAHTASIGYDENNLTVSQNRAKAIYHYLLYKDIPTANMIYVGLGETQLLNHCGNGVVCSEEEHMENQRVEIRIVK